MFKTTLLILSSLQLLCLADKQYCGPKQLGLFSIAHDVSARVLLTTLGGAAKRSSVFDPYCFVSQDGKTFLSLKTTMSEPRMVESVVLSDFPICMHVPIKVTAVDLRSWKTHEGVGLGSSEQQILRAYGQPSNRHSLDVKDQFAVSQFIHGFRAGDKVPPVGESQLYYRAPGDAPDDLSEADFGLRKGKVSFIDLSYSD